VNRRVLALVAALVLLPLPAVLAGIPLPTVPVGENCGLAGTDTCTATGYTPQHGYTFGFEGAFVGDLNLTMDAPGYHHEYVCLHTIFLGILAFDATSILGFCNHIGEFPPAGLPMTLTCASKGTGALVCSVTEG